MRYHDARAELKKRINALAAQGVPQTEAHSRVLREDSELRRDLISQANRRKAPEV